MSNARSFTAKTSREGRQFPHASSQETARHLGIKFEDLHRYLYHSNEVTFINKEDLRPSLQQKEEVKIYWCKVCHVKRHEVCPYHAAHESTEIASADNKNHQQLPNAIESIPNEVGLCMSSIPWAGFGVYARQHIPTGTWIGPYEGDILQSEELRVGIDSSYMWEIFHEGKLIYYLDGTDENKSSWMRYIRCARHKGEQNMFAFQYCANIYYRTFKDIAPGTELLVWYDDNYPQHMGIPLEIYETFAGGQANPREQNDVNVVVPRQPPVREPANQYRSTSASLSGLGVMRPLPFPPSAQEDGVTRTLSRRSISSTRSMPRKKAYTGRSTSRAYELPAIAQRPSYNKQDEEFQLEGRTVFSAADRSASWEEIEQKQRKSDPATSKVVSQRLRTPSHIAEDTEPEDEKDTENEDSSDSSDSSGFFNCGQCGKSFAQRSVLQIHVCPNVPRKPYHCGHCSQSFDHPNELRTHAVMHANEKPFKCGYCTRAFAGATTLHNHIRTHTGEKPFTCARCGKTFTQASQLHKHQRIPGDCLPEITL